MMGFYALRGNKSLREKVYDFLKEQMNEGKLVPGSIINLQEISKNLGISMTPLREALVKLEVEGFITIIPRRGVVLNTLTLSKIKEIYRVIGSLEAAALEDFYPLMNEETLSNLKELNTKMREALKSKDFDGYMDMNRNFHETWLVGCGNEELYKVVKSMKERLYEFPRNVDLILEWEEVSLSEHQMIIQYLEEKNIQKAVHYLKDVHWSYQQQEFYIKQYYAKHLENLEKMRKGFPTL
ncbi:GntR family transcriptional regulator [Thermovirga lienii]|jgi:DNA-binding GntR family transcriptional regulator|uniref:GntR family transcriptional regulator n=1 Tax=Thermovirga lienii TaxID=336261 RepID=UPI00074A7084|nr:MAG: Transcriptional regulator, GntR family [Thermovirga lienii]